MRIFSLWLLFLFSGPLWAGLHFEPYAGYGALWANDRLLNVRTETLSSSYEYIQEGRFYHGASGGARVGYSRLGLAVGLDFTLGRMWGVSEDLAPVIFGVFASYKFPALFRIYGVLIPGRLGSYPLSRWHIIPKQQTAEPAPFCNAWGGESGGQLFVPSLFQRQFRVSASSGFRIRRLQKCMVPFSDGFHQFHFVEEGLKGFVTP